MYAVDDIRVPRRYRREADITAEAVAPRRSQLDTRTADGIGAPDTAAELVRR